MQSRYAATRLAADCTVRAPLDCPDPEPGETLSDKHICGISYIDIPTYRLVLLGVPKLRCPSRS